MQSQLSKGVAECDPEEWDLYGPIQKPGFVSLTNGLSDFLFHAYCEDCPVSMDPNDVYIACLVQLSLFIHGHMALLRDRLVDFQGKKELVVETGSAMEDVDMGRVTTVFTTMMQENLKESGLEDDVVPNLSTTTEAHRIAARASLMASLQSIIRYGMCTKCNIPAVTLTGTVKDWVTIASKVRKLVARFDVEVEGSHPLRDWGDLVDQVLHEFIESRAGRPKQKFWNTVVHRKNGSGITYISGWLTIWSYFSPDGSPNRAYEPEDLYFPRNKKRHELSEEASAKLAAEVLINTPIISTTKLVSGAVSVPILVKDDVGGVHPSYLVAGNLIADMTVSADESGSPVLSLHSATDWYFGLYDPGNKE